MIRIARLQLVDGQRSRLEGVLEPGLRVEIRRDDRDPSSWVMLATHRLVAAPASAAPHSDELDLRPASKDARKTSAARDAIVLDDPLPFGDTL